MKNLSSISDQGFPITNAWYAVYVRSNHEILVHELLQEKGIKSSLPLKTVYRQWSDRRKKNQLPLFRGYVFVNIDIQRERLDVLQTEGVVKFITFGDRMIAIPEVQMYWMDKLLLRSNIDYEREFPLGAGVKVTYGPFKGLRGKVKENNSVTRLVVWFDAIMQGISVEIAPAYLQVTKRNLIS